MSGETAFVLRELEQLGVQPIVVASHPRSGTHLCIDLLRLNFPACRSRKNWFERADRLYFGLDALGRAESELDLQLLRTILGRVPNPIIKTHALRDLTYGGVQRKPWRLNPELASWFQENASFIYTYRDGREVLRSLYHYMHSFAPEARVPFSEFIRQEIAGRNRVRVWAEHVRSWLDHPCVLCVSMEQMRRGTAQTLSNLATFLHLPEIQHAPKVPPRCDSDFVSRAWRRLVPEPGSTAIVAYRKHECFNCWQDAFSDPADREFFHREAGDLLIALGYESSDQWVSAAQSDSQPAELPIRHQPPTSRQDPSSFRGHALESDHRKTEGVLAASS